jgi:hypothetical protein
MAFCPADGVLPGSGYFYPAEIFFARLKIILPGSKFFYPAQKKRFGGGHSKKFS